MILTDDLNHDLNRSI